MTRIFYSLVPRAFCSACLGAALVGLSSCGKGADDLQSRVRAAELERDAMKEEIAELRASLDGELSPAFEAELSAVKEELTTVRTANARFQREFKDFKKKFPLPGELVGK